MACSKTPGISSEGHKEVHCAHCSFYKPVINTDELKEGQHIKLQGQNKLKYDPKSRKRTSMYDHHAIVESVKRSDKTPYQVTLTVIHYADIKGTLFKEGIIKRETKDYNLKDDEIYIVKYPFGNSTAEEIVKRARLEISPILVHDVSMLDKGQSIKMRKKNDEAQGKFQFCLVTSVGNSLSKTERYVDLLPYTDQNECLVLGNSNEERTCIDLTSYEIYIVRDVHPGQIKDDIVYKIKRETNGQIISDTQLKRGQHLLMRKTQVGDTNRFEYAVVEDIDTTEYNSCLKLKMYSDLTGKVVRKIKREIIKKQDLGIYDIRLVRDTAPQESNHNDPYEIHDSIVGMLLGNKFIGYTLVSSNCEHFAVYCVVGGVSNFGRSLMKRLTGFVGILSGERSNLPGSTSFQVQRFMERLLFVVRLLSSELPKAVKVFHIIQRYFSKIFRSWSVHATPALCFLGFFVLYAIYVIYKTYSIHESFKSKLMCKSCYERRGYGLAGSFLFFTGSGVSGCIFLYTCLFLCCATTCYIAPGFCLLSIVTYVSVRLVVKRYERHNINIELRQRQLEVKDINDICRGDIIKFKYFKFWHYALVTGQKENDIEIIHYGFSGLTRTIVRETLAWVEGETIRKVDTKNIQSFEVNDVEFRINLAECRLGEQKWDPFRNRSDHLCQWVLETKSSLPYPVSTHDSEGSLDKCGANGYSSFSLEDLTIYIPDEISPYDVVKFKSYTGIVIETILKYKDFRKFKMKLLVNEKGKATRITLSVNLNKEHVYKKQFRPVHCCDKNEIETRIKRIIEGKTIPDGLDLITLCVARNLNSYDVMALVRNTSILDEMKKNQVPVESFESIVQGDIIIYKYLSLWHYALVTDKKQNDIHLIHYMVKGFGHEIASDKISWDKHKKTIWKVDTDQIRGVKMIKDPKARIQRAEGRLGERKWNILNNRSKHFCAFLLLDEKETLFDEAC